MSTAAEKVPITCPDCGKQIQVPARYVGKKGKCPGCKATFEIRISPIEEIVELERAEDYSLAPMSAAAALPAAHDPFASIQVYQHTQGPLSPSYLTPASTGTTPPPGLFMKVLSVVGSICVFVFLIALRQAVMMAHRDPSQMKLRLAWGLFFFGASIFSAGFSSVIIYKGLVALYTKEIPLTRNANIRGFAAQLGAVFFIFFGGSMLTAILAGAYAIAMAAK